MYALPELGRNNPVRILIVVDFPAPLGPRNPTHVFSCILKFKLFSAINFEYFFVRFSVTSISFMANFRRYVLL